MTRYRCYLDTTIRPCAATPVHLLVSDLPPPSSLSFTAELDVTIIDNGEKIDFNQVIIDFQGKTVLTPIVLISTGLADLNRGDLNR